MAATRRGPRAAVVAFVALAGIACVSALLSFSGSAVPMSVAKIAATKMPEVISDSGLLVLRCFMLATNIAATALQLRKVEDKKVVHDADSAFGEVHIRLCGSMWFSFFTVQSWCLQGAYLLGATVCSFISVCDLGWDLGSWLPTALWMGFEVSFPIAVLISTIVTYVLIPNAGGEAVRGFFHTPDLLMHNCNTGFMALELLFNDLPFTLTHFPMAVLWGLYYVVVSWGWLACHGVCWYSFLDPTKPKAIVIHLVLIAVLGAFFAIGAGLAAGASAIESPWARIGLVLLGVASVAKTGLLTGIPQPASEGRAKGE